MSKAFIPVQVWDETAKDTVKKYKVTGFPTFIIFDADGTELMRQVGAPFSKPDEAKKWFTKVGDSLEQVSKLEASHKEKPDDAGVSLKLAKAYGTLGKNKEALKLYEKVVPDLKKEDEGFVDANLGYADALMGTITRSNQAELGPKVGKIYDKILPDLVKAKDDRAIDPSILNARIKALLDKKYDDARTELKDLIKAFPDMERKNEARYLAASFAVANKDTETAKAEFQAIVDDGPATDRWVKGAKAQLGRMK